MSDQEPAADRGAYLLVLVIATLTGFSLGVAAMATLCLVGLP